MLIDAGFLLVRKEGLEPSRFYPPDPKSGASANSATFASRDIYNLSLVLELLPQVQRRLAVVAFTHVNDEDTDGSGFQQGSHVVRVRGDYSRQERVPRCPLYAAVREF